MNTHTLIKLSVSSTSHCWIVSSVHFSNVVPLQGTDLAHRQVPRQGDGQVVSQGEDLSALVFQVINQFGIFPILASQDFL